MKLKINYKGGTKEYVFPVFRPTLEIFFAVLCGFSIGMSRPILATLCICNIVLLEIDKYLVNKNKGGN